MLHSRFNIKYNIRLTCNVKSPSYEELLEKNKLEHATEMFKSKNYRSPESVSELFQRRETEHSPGVNQDFLLPSIRTVYHRTESTSYWGPNIRGMVLTEIRETSSINKFKNFVRKWVPQNCPCRLWKPYITGFGFINLSWLIWSIDLLDFNCFNLLPHRKNYLLSENLGETWVSQILIKATIRFWYYRDLTIQKPCFYSFGHWIFVFFTSYVF